MTDDLGGEVALPALATTANGKATPKKEDDQLKERGSANEIRSEPGEGQSDRAYKKGGGEGVVASSGVSVEKNVSCKAESRGKMALFS